MSSTHSQVVVAFDFTHSARAALYRAVALAARAPQHVLHFVCVIEPHKTYEDAARVQGLVADEVHAELRNANVLGRVHCYIHARIGKPADEILALAREVGADLIMVGTKGMTGVGRLVIGSVAEHVVREAGCTVEVARPKTYDYVDLLKVVDVEPHHAYVPPHRYSYDSHIFDRRPPDWPLY